MIFRSGFRRKYLRIRDAGKKIGRALGSKFGQTGLSIEWTNPDRNLSTPSTELDGKAHGVLLALIHANETNRLVKLRPALTKLCSLIDAALVEISEQPVIIPLSYRKAVWRRLVAYHWERRFKHYQGTFAELRKLRLVFGKWRLCFLNDRAMRRRLAIEPIVSQKHIDAWKQFLSSDRRFAIILESDAVTLADTGERILDLLRTLPESIETPIYVDLAGGLDLEGLGVQPSTVEKRGGFLHLKNFATNTVCGYLINRPFAKLLMEGLYTKPYFWFLPIDWLVIALVISSSDKGRIDCRHAIPTIFNHGSFTGEFISLVR